MSSSKTRDHRFDFFRGIALVAIAMNHTLPSRELVREHGHYQFGHIFAFNFADVFVFVSGVVCGMVYGRVLERHGFWETQRKALKRSLTLTLANGAAALACILVVWVFGLMHVHGEFHHLPEGSPLQAWLGTVGAYAALPLFDILPLYIIFLVGLPLVLWLHQRMGYWVLALLAMPYLVLNAMTLGAGKLDVPGSFFGHPAAWQLLFYGAVVLGVQQRRGALPSIPRLWGVPFVLVLLIGAKYADQVAGVVGALSNKDAAGPLRIAQLLGVTYLLSQWMPATGRWAEAGWTGAITRCGQNSLLVFCVSLVTSYTASLVAEALSLNRIGYMLLLALVALVTVLSARVSLTPRRAGA